MSPFLLMRVIDYASIRGLEIMLKEQNNKTIYTLVTCGETS